MQQRRLWSSATAILLVTLSAACATDHEHASTSDLATAYNLGGVTVGFDDKAGIPADWPLAVPKPSTATAGELAISYAEGTGDERSWLLGYEWRSASGCLEYLGALVRAGFKEVARFDSGGSVTGVFENASYSVTVGCSEQADLTISVAHP